MMVEGYHDWFKKKFVTQTFAYTHALAEKSTVNTFTSRVGPEVTKVIQQRDCSTYCWYKHSV